MTLTTLRFVEGNCLFHTFSFFPTFSLDFLAIFGENLWSDAEEGKSAAAGFRRRGARKRRKYVAPSLSLSKDEMKRTNEIQHASLRYRSSKCARKETKLSCQSE